LQNNTFLSFCYFSYVLDMYKNRKRSTKETAENGSSSKKQKRYTPTTSTSSRFSQELGRSIFLTASQFEGKVYVHIRKYSVQEEQKYPTKAGAGLSLIRWKTFENIFPNIRNSLDLNEDEYKAHIGGNWYVTVSPEFSNVDIRQFWLPPGENEVVATRKGISISKSEFRKLESLVEDLKRAVPELEEVQLCLAREDHQNQLGVLRCQECNPTDFHNW